MTILKAPQPNQTFWLRRGGAYISNDDAVITVENSIHEEDLRQAGCVTHTPSEAVSQSPEQPPTSGEEAVATVER